MTLAAAAGLPTLKEQMLKGCKVGTMTCKEHLDGYNNLDLWEGKTTRSARREYFYYDETAASKLWAPTAAAGFLQAHLQSLAEFPPRQRAESLSMKKSVENAMKAIEMGGAK